MGLFKNKEPDSVRVVAIGGVQPNPESSNEQLAVVGGMRVCDRELIVSAHFGDGDNQTHAQLAHSRGGGLTFIPGFPARQCEFTLLAWSGSNDRLADFVAHPAESGQRLRPKDGRRIQIGGRAVLVALVDQRNWENDEIVIPVSELTQ